MSGIELGFREVDGDRWDDLVRLFEERGGPKNCWCMAWRGRPVESNRGSAKERKAALKAALHARVSGGVPIGLLAYHDGRPVAWCSIAPRVTYRRLGGPEGPGDGGDAVWSLVCFFVKRAFRGRGVTSQLIHAAVACAHRHGATVVEAYPVDPESPSYRFMGLVGAFEEAGFTEVGRAGSRRHVMRLSL